MLGSTTKLRVCPAATDRIPGANAVDASFPHRMSNNEVSNTGPWLSESDRFRTVKKLERKAPRDKGHTLFPGGFSFAAVDQGVEVVVGMNHRGGGQQNREQMHIEQN